MIDKQVVQRQPEVVRHGKFPLYQNELNVIRRVIDELWITYNQPLQLIFVFVMMLFGRKCVFP